MSDYTRHSVLWLRLWQKYNSKWDRVAYHKRNFVTLTRHCNGGYVSARINRGKTNWFQLCANTVYRPQLGFDGNKGLLFTGFFWIIMEKKYDVRIQAETK